MKRKELTEIVRDLCGPFRVSTGKDSRLKNVDPDDTDSLSQRTSRKLDSGGEIKMKPAYLRENWNRLAQRFRNHRRHQRSRHDPWLVLNMTAFNFDGTRNRVFDPLRDAAIGRS